MEEGALREAVADRLWRGHAERLWQGWQLQPQPLQCLGRFKMEGDPGLGNTELSHVRLAARYVVAYDAGVVEGLLNQTLQVAWLVGELGRWPGGGSTVGDEGAVEEEEEVARWGNGVGAGTWRRVRRERGTGWRVTDEAPACRGALCAWGFAGGRAVCVLG